MTTGKPWKIVLGGLAILAICLGSAFLLILHRMPGRSYLQRMKALVVATELSHPGVLWRVVHDGCLAAQTSIGVPAPCLEVNLKRGYAIIKDPERATQLLLVPTRRIPGIESPLLLVDGSENYWFDAWSAKHWLEREVGAPIPHADLGLAMNSIFSRTQDQLHIHIDCVRSEARVLVDAAVPTLGRHWTGRPLRLGGTSYDALWIDGDDLARSNPFRLLAEDGRARGDMGSYSLALLGAERPGGPPGFVLLRSHESPANGGAPSGERLLDHHCQILKSDPSRR